jgi:hypothetical protein
MISDLYLTLAVQSTVVLGSASLVTMLLRKKSAAVRHAVWAASFVVLLLLPVLPQSSWFSMTQSVAPPAVLVEPIGRTRITVNGSTAVNWIAVAMLVHLVGALLLLLRSVVARMVLEEKPVQTPMVVGLLRPRVLWPAGAEEWSAERREAAWQHERQHIGRLDLWWELFGLIGTALYWPHPLVWWARKKMTEECEQACDDGVLVGGLAASRYAGHLIEIAREMRSDEKNVSLAGGLAMTRGKNLEQRVIVLLDETRARSGVTRKTVGLVALCAMGLLVPLSGYKLLAQSSGGGLSGVVRDASGAAVPDVRVTVSLGERVEAVRSNAAGVYNFPGLTPGNWTVTVQHPGFAQLEVKGLAVEGGATEFNPVLNLGKIVETVQVKGDGMPPPPPPPPPAPGGSGPQRLRVGGNVQSAKVVSRVAPVYPPDCKAEGVTGIVLMRAVIGKDGSVISLQPRNQLVDQRLVRSAMEAVQQWRYNTTLLNGNPVEVLTEIEVNFTLAR